jgi:hypothetical protein
MLQVAGVTLSPIMQTLLRLLAAAATLSLVLIAQRKLPKEWAGTYCYLLAICFLMLFNPRTENNSYAALAPAIGILCCRDVLVRHKIPMALWYALISLGIVGTYDVGRLLTGPQRTSWLAPLLGACFTATAIAKLLRWPAEPFDDALTTAVPEARASSASVSTIATNSCESPSPQAA